MLSAELFKAYDIRGIVGRTLTDKAMVLIGQALASMILARGGRAVVIGRDGRLSGPQLLAALRQGVCAAGVDVIDVDAVTTPMGYFAAHHLGVGSAAIVTGSHNPPDYNGLKMVVQGETLAGEAIQDLRRRIEAGNLARGVGKYRTHAIGPAYIERIVADVKLARPMKIVIDSGNGVAGAYAPALFRALGCTVEPLFCEVDGRFPNHHPDPSVPDNLAALRARVQASEAEIGLAFDGDGDRLGVVTRAGRIIHPDRLLMLFAADVLARHPGARVLYDVKCTRHLAPWIRAHGGVPELYRTGHSLIKARLRESGALLAGEMSGHVFFAERWYGFDDGLYAGARLLEILARTDDPAAVLDALPDAVNTPELHVAMAEGEPHRLIAELTDSARFEGADEVITLDGLRVEYPDGFGLMRPSNTTPVVVLRFEAENAAALARIQADFRRVLHAVRPDLVLPF